MAIKKTGISRDLIIHPGETIADILEARNMTQAELAVRTGVSPAFVGNVIAGRKDISGKFAMALEYALEVPKSFWLNLQARYDAEILEADEESTISDEEKLVRKDLNEVVKYLRKRSALPVKESTSESIISLRKVLKVSSLCNLKKIPISSAFRISSQKKINPSVLGAWIRICQIHECTFDIEKNFNTNEIDSLINDLKNLMLSDTTELPQKIKMVFYEYGLDFEIVQHFRGAPVQGFLYKRIDNRIKICMTIRGAFADIFWFSLFHELGHLYNGDLSKTSQFLDDGVDIIKEEAADRFASDKLINGDEYKIFVSKYKNSPSFELIERFASTQKIRPFIVIGRMQKEGIIAYQQYSFAKIRYKWAE
ncbi:HigA family addiction module antitoxin [Ruminococcus albus]|uniref:HTH-type transcriptional regulator / antitoxin HigA n=1 Tax=Ruminococcus albus TaxID=1264 RepID=A0A1H7LHF6_RUMAL|nr:HigA family addiction module antitoxin [Ruminococcus albus]SEK98278.1 HTH-type transcriptional regulator / antitoxin HigA [Ruminococcus albus]